MVFATSDNSGAGSEPGAGAQASAQAGQSAGAGTMAGDESDLNDAVDDGQGNLATDIDEIEEELDGVKVKGKKEAVEKLKSERSMHADYTRKTMSHAEKVQAFEAREQRFQETEQTHQAFIKEVAAVTAIEQRLQYLLNLDLQAINARNPQQAQAASLEIQKLQAHRGQVLDAVTQKQEQIQRARSQEMATRARDVEAYLRREIKDWSPERDRELETYVKSKGIDSRALGNFMLYNPAIAAVVNDAAQFARLMKERTKRPAGEGQPPKAGTRVGGAGNSTTKPLSEVRDPAEWRRLRDKRKNRT